MDGPLAVKIGELPWHHQGARSARCSVSGRRRSAPPPSGRAARTVRPPPSGRGHARVASEGDLSASDLVRLVEAIHKEYDDGTIDLDEFEEKKQALLARVKID